MVEDLNAGFAGRVKISTQEFNQTYDKDSRYASDARQNSGSNMTISRNKKK